MPFTNIEKLGKDQDWESHDLVMTMLGFGWPFDTCVELGSKEMHVCVTQKDPNLYRVWRVKRLSDGK